MVFILVLRILRVLTSRSTKQWMLLCVRHVGLKVQIFHILALLNNIIICRLLIHRLT